MSPYFIRRTREGFAVHHDHHGEVADGFACRAGAEHFIADCEVRDAAADLGIERRA